MSAHDHPPRPAGYEHRDINLPQILRVTAITLILLLISIAILDTYYTLYKEEQIRKMYLEVENPALGKLRAQETEIMKTFGPADTLGIAYRIPVEQAREELLKQGSTGPVSDKPQTRRSARQ